MTMITALIISVFGALIPAAMLFSFVYEMWTGKRLLAKSEARPASELSPAAQALILLSIGSTILLCAAGFGAIMNAAIARG